MEKINQILDNIKERLASPFFFSFIVSWIFCNWQIVVALLWFDPPVEYKGHLGLIKFIDAEANNLNSIIYPFLLACFYTFAWPIINNWIIGFQTWNTGWGNKWHLRISDGSYIPIDRYYKLREDYDKNLKSLKDVLASESQTLTALQQTENSLLEERRLHQESKHNLAEVKGQVDNYGRISILSGKWSKVSKGSFGIHTENIEVQNSNIYLYEDNSMNQKYSIHNFSYDRGNGKVVFALFHFEANNRPEYAFFSFNDLTYRHNEITGIEYRKGESVTVRYIRPENP